MWPQRLRLVECGHRPGMPRVAGPNQKLVGARKAPIRVETCRHLDFRLPGSRPMEE